MNDPDFLIHILLLAVISILAIANACERARSFRREDKLLNRIMAKDFAGYVEGEIDLANKEAKVPTVDDVVQNMYENEGYSPDGLPVG